MIPRPEINIERWRHYDELDRPSFVYYFTFKIYWVFPDFSFLFSRFKNSDNSVDLDDIPF